MIFKRHLLLHFILIFFFNLSISSASDKTTYIDIDYLINKSNLGKSISLTLNNLKKKNLENLKIQEKDLKNKDEEIAKIKNVISKSELEKKIKTLKIEINEFNNLKDKILIETNKIRQEELNRFFKKVNPLIQKYMDDNSIDIIIDKKNIFIARSEYDITQDILNLINENFK